MGSKFQNNPQQKMAKKLTNISFWDTKGLKN